MGTESVVAALTTTDLTVGGMTCAACVRRVEKKLGRLDGVTAVVNLATGRARVSHPPSQRSGENGTSRRSTVALWTWFATPRPNRLSAPSPQSPAVTPWACIAWASRPK